MPKKPKTKPCPFKVGDVVRPKPEDDHGLPTLVVTRTKLIPDIQKESYGDDVRAVPYWVYGKDIKTGKVFKTKHQSDNYAIWVGFLELDPFLGAAKRAVMEAENA